MFMPAQICRSHNANLGNQVRQSKVELPTLPRNTCPGLTNYLEHLQGNHTRMVVKDAVKGSYTSKAT